MRVSHRLSKAQPELPTRKSGTRVQPPDVHVYSYAHPSLIGFNYYPMKPGMLKLLPMAHRTTPLSSIAHQPLAHFVHVQMFAGLLCSLHAAQLCNQALLTSL